MSAKEAFYKVPHPVFSIGEGCNCSALESVKLESVAECSDQSQQQRFAGNAMAQQMPYRYHFETAFIHRNCLKIKLQHYSDKSDCNKPLIHHGRLPLLGRVPQLQNFSFEGRSWYIREEVNTINGNLMYSGMSKRKPNGISCRLTPHGPHIHTMRFYPDIVPWDIEHWMEQYGCELAKDPGWAEYVAQHR